MSERNRLLERIDENIKEFKELDQEMSDNINNIKDLTSDDILNRRINAKTRLQYLKEKRKIIGNDVFVFYVTKMDLIKNERTG